MGLLCCLKILENKIKIQLNSLSSKNLTGISLVILWLELGASTTEGMGLIPSQGTKILNASLWGLKNRIPQTDHVTLFVFEDLQ